MRRFLVAWACGASVGITLALGACGSNGDETRANANASDANASDANADGLDGVATSTDGAREDGDASETSACGAMPPVTPVSAPPSAPIAIANDPPAALGVFDPSLVYPAGAPGGVLAYSAVGTDQVSTRIAVSLDRGASFTYVAAPNQPTAITVEMKSASVCGGATCSGTLWHEVPSIIADDDPDADRAFKLFVHSYVNAPSATPKPRRELGYIGMQTAPKPEGPWSAEVKQIGWSTPESSFSSEGAKLVATDIPALADCVALSEPAALRSPLGIELALTCIYLEGTPKIRVVQFRSTDHAASFAYVGVLLRAEDAACLGGEAPMLSAPGLFIAGGKPYLLVTSVGHVSPSLDPSGVDYRACLTIPIDDLASATVARPRGAGGAPAVLRELRASDGRFAGACAYAEGATAAGYLVPELYATAPAFRILRTALGAP